VYFRDLVRFKVLVKASLLSVSIDLRFFRDSFCLTAFTVGNSGATEDREVGRQSTELMTSGRSRRNYDEVLLVDVADTTGIPACARKRSRIFEEPEVEERVKRPMNAFMVWSQVIIWNSYSRISI